MFPKNAYNNSPLYFIRIGIFHFYIIFNKRIVEHDKAAFT